MLWAGALGLALAHGSLAAADSWSDAVNQSAPKYWYSFEEGDPSQPALNQGSADGWAGAYGSGITWEDLNVSSGLPGLGNALEFTGPESGATTTKFVDLSVNSTSPGDGIPELVNYRTAMADKTTTVEYWIKTTQKGTSDNQTWNSPAILAHESPGDGDMYWGWINDQGDFGFSTSDSMEVFAKRDGTNINVGDGKWHHVVMIKNWRVTQLCTSTMYIDGGSAQGGVTITRTTAAGNASYQDTDSGIRYLGFTHNGGTANNQFIGTLDELAIYDRALTAEEAGLHFASVATVDTDGDGMPDLWEIANSLDPQTDDADADPDLDGLTNIEEYQLGSDPQKEDTDEDGLSDLVETNTGIWTSAENTGTSPVKADTDGDTLSDKVETNTGVFVDAENTGTNPLLKDTDADSYNDNVEIQVGSNPNDKNSIPPAGDWTVAITMSAPKYWYRFDETEATQTATNKGSASGWNGVYGAGMTTENVGRPSALPAMGNALEFTGPESGAGTTKYVDLAANAANPDSGIPELTNFRPPVLDKTTTVEYWIKTTQKGSSGSQTWMSPAILAHESGGDGDMYWGWMNSAGDFGFSTSDLMEIFAIRDGTNINVTDGQWHHIVMTKEWHVNENCVSTMHIDGGQLQHGVTITPHDRGGQCELSRYRRRHPLSRVHSKRRQRQQPISLACWMS